MSKKINLVEILKNVPAGTKLWSPLFGQVEFTRLNLDNDYYPIEIRTKNYYNSFTKYGCFIIDYEDDECVLFPSREQRDWLKFEPFQIKAGQYYMCTCDVIMDEDPDDIAYREGRVYKSERDWCITDEDGLEDHSWYLDDEEDDDLYFYHFRPADPSECPQEPEKPKEKKDEGKVKVTLHPFDRVLARYGDEYKWGADIFSHKEKGWYLCVGTSYKQCIPYTRSTAHLLGTTDPCQIDYEIELSKDYCK